MSKHNRKKNMQPISGHNQDDYDLKSSLNKVNQKRSLKTKETISDFETVQTKSQPIDSTSLASNQGVTTSIFFQLSESFNKKYDKLRDDISGIGDKISTSNDDLRKELEGKISDKIGSKLFYGAVAVVCVIAAIIYALSYSSLIEKTENNETNIKTIMEQKTNINSRLNSVELKIEKIDEKQDYIEKELIKK